MEMTGKIGEATRVNSSAFLRGESVNPQTSRILSIFLIFPYASGSSKSRYMRVPKEQTEQWNWNKLDRTFLSFILSWRQLADSYLIKESQGISSHLQFLCPGVEPVEKEVQLGVGESPINFLGSSSGFLFSVSKDGEQWKCSLESWPLCRHLLTFDLFYACLSSYSSSPPYTTLPWSNFF